MFRAAGLVAALLLVVSVEAQEFGVSKRKVVKTDEQWAKQLQPEQFMVTRRKATEVAFSGKYWNNHSKGTYSCVCCNAPLFSSQAKSLKFAALGGSGTTSDKSKSKSKTKSTAKAKTKAKAAEKDAEKSDAPPADAPPAEKPGEPKAADGKGAKGE
jgi:peptide methionine sulfoxide reductase MsrB